MHATLLTVGLLTGSGAFNPEAGFDSHAEAAAAIAPQLQTGALIFSEGDCLAVRIFTASPYTHVAVVVAAEDETRWVYDSTGGVGVRRLTLQQYLTTQAPTQIHVHRPQQPLTTAQTNTLQAYLDAQMGRPYAISHHVTGKRCEGLHCAEYVTDALMAIDLIRAQQPPKVSPASLREGVTLHNVYTPGRSIQLQRPSPPPEPASNRCEQLWIDTKACCGRCCRKLQGWFLCQ